MMQDAITSPVPLIGDRIHDQVLQRLVRIEEQEKIRILLAVETGSRAWGFASANSDYDVRFIYVRELREYLSLVEGRDVIETPIVDDLDIQGWDIRKALRLFAKSNPVLNEWLVSPYIYVRRGHLAEQLVELARSNFSPKACAYHYLHMARHQIASDFYKGEGVILKKYLYVLRPLINIIWLREFDSLPPIEVTRSLDEISLADEVRDAIKALIAEKQSGAELGRGARRPVLDTALQHMFQIAEDYCGKAVSRKPDFNTLNDIFHEVVLSDK